MILPPLAELLVGEETSLDPLCELDLHLRVEQRDLADLLEVVLDRVGGRAGDHDLLDRLVRLVRLGDDEAFALVLLLLQRRVGRDVLLELGIRDVREDLLAVGPDRDLGHGGCTIAGGLRGLLGRRLLCSALGRGLLRRQASCRRSWRPPSWQRVPSWRVPSCLRWRSGRSWGHVQPLLLRTVESESGRGKDRTCQQPQVPFWHGPARNQGSDRARARISAVGPRPGDRTCPSTPVCATAEESPPVGVDHAFVRSA